MKRHLILYINENEGIMLPTLAKIPFNKPFINEVILQSVTHKMTHNPFGNMEAVGQLEETLRKTLRLCEETDVFFTQSATQALEIMALSLDLQMGDEIILPSYTYAATANAFARTGATLVFADVAFETLNITTQTVEPLITERTKAIIPIHYGGCAADLNGLLELSKTHSIKLLEDAAHGLGATYEGKPLGTMGEMGCLSFHHTKNLTAGGSGGLLFINQDKINTHNIEEIYYQGTDRVAFLSGKASAYHWQRLGGEYTMTAYAMAFLEASLPELEMVTKRRSMLWHRYHAAFLERLSKWPILLPSFDEKVRCNGHIYYLILPDAMIREGLRCYLKDRNIDAYTHYEPLHLSPAGKRYGKGAANLPNTEAIAQGLLRLPLYYDLSLSEQDRVIEAVVGYITEKMAKT